MPELSTLLPLEDLEGTPTAATVEGAAAATAATSAAAEATSESELHVETTTHRTISSKVKSR